jgi:hypothetical protein
MAPQPTREDTCGLRFRSQMLPMAGLRVRWRNYERSNSQTRVTR